MEPLALRLVDFAQFLFGIHGHAIEIDAAVRRKEEVEEKRRSPTCAEMQRQRREKRR